MIKPSVSSYQRWLEKQNRLRIIALSLSSHRRRETMLRAVRDGIVEEKIFDRAGVFLVDENHVTGSWGTDLFGAVRDERHYCVPRSQWSDILDPLASGKERAVLKEYRRHDENDESRAIYPCAILPLMSGGRLLGVVCVDNVVSRRPIEDADIAILAPLLDLTALTLRYTELLHNLSDQIERQRRLAVLAADIAANNEVGSLLQMLRDRFLEASGFERAALFLYREEDDTYSGIWATDKSGNSHDISEEIFPFVDKVLPAKMIRGELDYVLYTDFTRQCKLPREHPMYGVHAHAILPLRALGEVIGLLCVDTFFSDRSITSEEIESLLPFAIQVGIALKQAR